MSDGIQISAADIQDFQDDGVVALRGVFDLRWLDSLAIGVEKNFADPSPDACHYTPEGAPGGFYDDYCNWDRIEEYRDFAMASPAAEIVGRLMGSIRVRFYHEHVLVKEPGTHEITPWHHDLPYYGLEGTQLCSIWLPLDPVPKSVSPEFVAGSHRWGKRFVPRKFVDHRNYGDIEEGYEQVPDIDAQRADLRIRSWELEPGDCIVFHMATLHGAPGTAALTTRRRGFSTRWLGDDAVYATRPWPTSPPFRGVDVEPGQPVDDPAFPLVWTAPAESRS